MLIVLDPLGKFVIDDVEGDDWVRYASRKRIGVEQSSSNERWGRRILCHSFFRNIGTRENSRNIP